MSGSKGLKSAVALMVGEAKRPPTLLEGEALAVWLELSDDKQKSYKDAKAKIMERMGPVQFVLMDNFNWHRLLPVNLSLYSFTS